MKTSPTLKLLLLSFLIACFSCEEEALFQPINEKEMAKEQAVKPFTLIQEVQNSFSLENFNDPTEQIKDNIEIDWDNYKTSLIDNQEWYEFTVSEKRPSSVENSRIKGQNYTLLATKAKTSFKYYLNKMVSFSDHRSNAYFDIEKDNYHGMVYLYNMKGISEYILHYQKGVRMSSVEDMDVDVDKNVKSFVELTSKEGCQLKASTTAKYCESDSAYNCAMGMDSGPDCNATSGGYLPLTTSYYVDWYNNRGGYYDYSYTQYQGSSTEYVWVSSGSSSGSYISYSYAVNDGSGGVTYSNTRPSGTSAEYDKIILDSSFSQNDKIKCTHQRLMRTTNYKDLLKDFFGDDAEFDVTFKVVKNLSCLGSNDVNGCTTATYNYVDKQVEIAIDKDYIDNVQTPTLFIAKTLIHEAIHANLFLSVKKLNGGVAPINSDFGTLYEEYRKQRNWQHEYMANKYVDLIADGLKDVHQNIGDEKMIEGYSDNTLWNWNSFYSTLAWQGLKSTVRGQIQSSTQQFIMDENLYINGAKANSTKEANCIIKS